MTGDKATTAPPHPSPHGKDPVSAGNPEPVSPVQDERQGTAGAPPARRKTLQAVAGFDPDF
nr:hypothetical protein [uncultured Novosphingobium sp.]